MRGFVSQEQAVQAAGEGRLVARRYLIVAGLGSGGFGRVWHARDTVLDIDVAVKQLVVPLDLPEYSRAELLARAQREAANAARLRGNPNIVSDHDVVLDDGEPWLIMELLVGRSLAEHLQARGSLPVREAAGVARAVLLALSSCHSAGIVHRDVKPANVMLCDEGRVVLTDFGISMLATDNGLTAAGQFVGSVDYIAPERISGDKARPASDMFSLGAMLYHVVEGVPPFRRETAAATIGAVLMQEPVPLVKAGNLAPVIVALLNKNPDARPDVEHALGLLDGQAATAPAAGETSQPARATASAQVRVPAQMRAPTSRQRARWLVLPVCAFLFAVAVTTFLLTRAPAAATAPVPVASWLHTATFNGKNTQAVLPGSALKTGPGASFTVSAWVDLFNTGAFATAVSQDATVRSSFYLQYSPANNAWAFSRFVSDAQGATGVRAVSRVPPITGQWTHLVGVYDSSDGRLLLYVNGILQGTAPDITPFAGHGVVIIGRAKARGQFSDWFPGMLRNVEVFQQALSASQVKVLP